MSIIHKKLREALGLQFAGNAKKAERLRLEVKHIVFCYEQRTGQCLPKLGTSETPLTLHEFRAKLVAVGWNDGGGCYYKAFGGNYAIIRKTGGTLTGASGINSEAQKVINDFNNLKQFYDECKN